jgi:hypothetical protein
MIREIELSPFYLVIMKINKAEMIRMIGEGKPYKEIMEKFGCTKSAVSSAQQRIKKSFNTPIPKTSELSKDNIDAMAQLKYINDTIIGQLKSCEKFILREDKKMAEFDRLTEESEICTDENRKLEIAEKLSKLADNTKGILKIQDNLVNISGEVRKQIELQLKIAETLYNIQMTAEFQNEVIAGIREVDPLTAKKIVDKLREKRALRGLVKL